MSLLLFLDVSSLNLSLVFGPGFFLMFFNGLPSCRAPLWVGNIPHHQENLTYPLGKELPYPDANNC